MTANHEYAPTTDDIRNAVTRDESDWREAGAQFDRWLAERDARISAAAEQRGAARALRDAATRLRDSKFANSVKPPHEKAQVPEANWLERQANRLEADE